MANLTETSTFDAGVYQIETTDPVIGGPSGVTNAPLKNLANRTRFLKDRVDSITTDISALAPKASPAFTGNPTAPTPSVGDNDTSIATTAFVNTAITNAAPNLSGYAPLASPSLTGNPTAPTAVQFDNDTSIATTAFVQRALGSLAGVVGNTSATLNVNASHMGKHIYCTAGSSVINLPNANSVPEGSVVSIHSIVSVTINRSGADLIFPCDGGAGVAALPLFRTNVILVATSFGWASMGGSATLPYTGGYAKYHASTGYQKLPSGLIIQWGLSVVNAGATIYVTLPLAMPGQLYNVTSCASWSSADQNAFPVSPHSYSTTGFYLYNASLATALTTSWIAIGV